MTFLVKNGRIINPLTNEDKIADILVKDGIIEEIGENLESDLAGTVIDATGLTVFPGLCDVHVHFRDPGWPEKETIESGAKAAIAGGVTTVVCMANTNPVCDNPETIKYILEKGMKTPITVLQNSAMTKGLKGEELVDAKAMLEAGACGFSDDGIPITNPKLMVEALKIAKETGKVLSVHEELPQLLFSQGVNFGEVSRKLGLGGASANAETSIVARDIELQSVYGGHLHIQHASAAGTVELVREAKKRGQQVTMEVTGQHLALTEDIVLEVGAVGRINPPIRTEKDRQALIQGVKDGTIDMVVTDHAPHTSAEKSKPIAEAPSGMIGLETSLAVTFDTLVNKEGVDRLTVAKLMSTNPAAMYGIEKNIAVGKVADFCIFDENEEWVVTEFKSNSTNSPFLGKTLKTKVKYTIIGEFIEKI